MSAEDNAMRFAFPVADSTGEATARGLNKREWFAGMAMIGNLANSDPHLRPTSQAQVVKWSVEIADALIAELAKAESEPAP